MGRAFKEGFKIIERRGTMRIKKKKWFLTGMVLILLVMPLFRSDASEAAAPEGIFKEAIHWSLSADWLDPAYCADIGTQLPLYLLHDALLKPMPQGNYTPCLAESWTVSPDKKVVDFKLRKGVKFHNGDTVTAEDVIFSFWRYRARAAKLIHGKTEKVEAVNPNHVRFRFKEGFPDFLDYLLPGATSIGWVVPKKYMEKVGDAGFKKHPIGCGPYKFVEFKAGQKLVAEAFDGFWRKVPHIKRMEFHTVRDPGTRLVMLRRGETDIATLMTDVFYEDVKKDPKLRLAHPISPTQWIVYISPQFDPKSPWSDARVRKAASLAIDRQSICDVHAAGSKPIGDITLEGDPEGVQFPPDPYDPAQAKKLLAEAGYPNGFHGGKFYPYQGAYWPMGEQIANYWKAVGISIDTILLDRPAVIAMREGGKFKGSLFVDTPAAPTIGGRFSVLFGKGSYDNYPDIQALWDQYNKEVDPQVRKDLIARMQKLIYERTMWIPIRSSVSAAAVGPRVKGNPYKLQPPIFPIWWTGPFEDIELKK
jgi:peptide/nickel transport system substrate-binding protein